MDILLDVVQIVLEAGIIFMLIKMHKDRED